MDKQKQIEEMAKVLAVNCGECYTCKFQGDIHCVDFLSAEELYNAGYRKIPENAVVLTEGEYEELQKGIKTYNYTAMFDAQDAYRWEQGYLQGRKETVDKFVERLKEMAYQSTDWSHGEHPMVVEVDYIDEIANEIKEGKV